ncbi:MAG: efflux transporter outer membrane subunit [Syntrophobacteraceae bacterium]
MKREARKLFHCLQRSLLTAVICISLSGCMVGPDFRKPEAPSVMDYTSTALPRETAGANVSGGAAQYFAVGKEISAQWWQLFNNPAIDQLIRQALADSPTPAAAKATLRKARENLRARSGTEYFPQADASLSASRQKVSSAEYGLPNSPPVTYGLFNASVSVSYTLDIFGGGRRELEALQSQVDYQQYQLEAAYLALSANIVTAAVQEASLRSQLKATEEIIVLSEKLLKLVERHNELGGASRAEVLTQQAQAAQFRANLPPLEKELARTRNQLALYVGTFPGEARLPEFTLDQLNLPQELPISLPSSLVRQRPDIRAAQALLHAASARVGVATANLYPQITLTGSLGSQALTLAEVVSNNASVWSIGAGLVQPVFRGGELTAKRRAAIADYDAAAAQYRETLLEAFQNVADVLEALDADAVRLAAQVEAERAARGSLELTQRQFECGTGNYLLLLIAQRQEQQARINLAQAQAARFADTAALFQSLGGGWWNREESERHQAVVKKEKK